jgi:hypothetical protein
MFLSLQYLPHWLCFLIFLSGCEPGTKMIPGEIHILPNGYTGNVMIIFDQPNGVPKKMYKGFRLYEIPDSGILRTREKFEIGYFPCTDYYFNYVGNNDTIPITIKSDKWPDSMIHSDKIYMLNEKRSYDTIQYQIGHPQMRQVDR